MGISEDWEASGARGSFCAGRWFILIPCVEDEGRKEQEYEDKGVHVGLGRLRGVLERMT